MSHQVEHDLVVGIQDCTDNKTEVKTVFLEVTNKGPTPIGQIKVEWVYQYDKPQDVKKVSGKDIVIGLAGKRLGFCAQGEKDGPLAVGECREFAYPPHWMNELLSVVQSLSPERYHVAITTDGKEQTMMEGTQFGDFIDRRFGNS